MTYEYKSHIYLAEAVLNVKDLASQTAFYRASAGLEILSQTETEVVLGLGGKALVHLIQTQESGEVREHYGLLPSGHSLADTKGFGGCLEAPDRFTDSSSWRCRPWVQ